jgi:aminomethyltransferase
MYIPDGSKHESCIVALPFFDRKKNIVRGLDQTIPNRPT